MNEQPIPSENPETVATTGGFRLWHWLVFFAPSIVSNTTTWALLAARRAEDAASGYTLLTDYQRQHLILGPGLNGLVAGTVCCAISGIVLGLTTGSRRTVPAALLRMIAWLIAVTLTNLVLAFAGCSLLDNGTAAPPR